MDDQHKRRELLITNYGKFGGSCTAIGQGTTVSHT